MIEGWSPPEVPPNPELRAELESYAAEHGWQKLFERLLAIDPEAQAFIEPRNIRRVVRAIEVTQMSGKPFSEQRQKHPPPYRILQIGLTMDRYRRTNAQIAELI